MCDGVDVQSAQAGPSDPDNFPFVVIGNKVDKDERLVRHPCFRLSFSQQKDFQDLTTFYMVLFLLPIFIRAGDAKTRTFLVPVKGRHSLLRVLCEGRPQCGQGL